MTTFRDLREAYQLVWRRRRLLFRAMRNRNQLKPIAVRTGSIEHDAILAFVTLRNEMERLPYFLDHYRSLGVSHFLIVDNDSQDGSLEFLRNLEDVSIWSTSDSYRLSRFGLDWLTWLQIKYGHGHWCLTLDADELLVYPHHDTRDLVALTHWLDDQDHQAFPAMMLDMYPKGKLSGSKHAPHADPIETLQWFDHGNYMIQHQPRLDSLWIQGGPRARSFFFADPRRAPTLNKIPLIKWNRRFAYVNSTHAALPRKLNRVYGNGDGEEISGVLLHTKFLPTIVAKSVDEKDRKEHFANSDLYDAYYDRLVEDPNLHTPQSTRYLGWRQLEALGLMSRGGWH